MEILPAFVTFGETTVGVNARAKGSRFAVFPEKIHDGRAVSTHSFEAKARFGIPLFIIERSQEIHGLQPRLLKGSIQENSELFLGFQEVVRGLRGLGQAEVLVKLVRHAIVLGKVSLVPTREFMTKFCEVCLASLILASSTKYGERWFDLEELKHGGGGFKRSGAALAARSKSSSAKCNFFGSCLIKLC